ncbi:MAG: hypothetical protein MI975_05975 [Cytophagales bacterium]|nr:hypothetical protein [Cytophagales bacterium]
MKQAMPEIINEAHKDTIVLGKWQCFCKKKMKPVGPEQIQDTQEHDYIALVVSNLKKRNK